MLIAARDAWMADPNNAGVFEELAALGKSEPFATCQELGTLFGGLDAARAFADGLLDHLLPALRDRPLGMAPFRHVSERGVASLMIARSGGAMLMLSAREPGRIDHFSAGFSDGERRKIVLAGRGTARLVALRSAGSGKAHLESSPCQMRPGKCFAFDQARQTMLVELVEQRLVVLRLIRTPEKPQPSREFSLADGALQHQASGEIGESRFEMMLALLGRMERRDAAPEMAEMAREGSMHLRWHALRECLALDSAIGFRALCEIARDASDELAPPAGALRAQLLEAHPELARLELA